MICINHYHINALGRILLTTLARFCYKRVCMYLKVNSKGKEQIRMLNIKLCFRGLSRDSTVDRATSPFPQWSPPQPKIQPPSGKESVLSQTTKVKAQFYLPNSLMSSPSPCSKLVFPMEIFLINRILPSFFKQRMGMDLALKLQLWVLIWITMIMLPQSGGCQFSFHLFTSQEIFQWLENLENALHHDRIVACGTTKFAQ